MSRKNFLNPFPLFSGSSMQPNLLSDIIDISYLDNVSFQFVWTGDATGEFTIEGSLSNNTVPSIGNVPVFDQIVLSSPIKPAGTADSVLVDMNNLSFPYIRVRYTTSFKESYTVTTVADSSGSLNNKYFLLDAADGSLYYIWYNINSAGVDPAIPGRTGIQVAAATNASANTIASATNTAFAGNPDFTSSVSTNVVTLTQINAGTGDIDDGAAPTGFSFMENQTTGIASVKISGKQA